MFVSTRTAATLALLLVACGTPDAAGCPGAGAHDEAFGGIAYTLRAPIAHDCSVPTALVVDLAPDRDDGYASALDAIADHAFLLVRVRAADVDVARIEAIVQALRTRTAIDRVFVVGAGDGAALAARWLHEGTLVPEGIALIDDASSLDEAARAIRDFGSARPRVWCSTGARAAGFDASRVLLASLARAGFDGALVHTRERDDAGASHAWLAAELWEWLDLAEWPESGPPAQPWEYARFPTDDAALLSIDAMPDGTLRVGALDGRVFGTDDSNKWNLLAETGPGALVSMLAADGTPLVASTAGMVRSDDGLAFARDAMRSDVIAIADRGDALFGVSDGGVVRSIDDGVHWTLVHAADRLDAIAISVATHTVIAVGASEHVRVVGDTAASLAIAASLDDVAVGIDGAWWVVGADGAVLRSIDDGLVFTRVVDPEDVLHDDLYAVAIGADGAMLAGGARGTVVVSHDGTTLVRWPTGRQGLVGAVRWLGPGSAMILANCSVATATGL